MDKITFDGDQIKFPASAILQEDLEGDISELKEDLSDIPTETVKNSKYLSDITISKQKHVWNEIRRTLLI